jgi:ABC-type lipoprotein export system ATPase subunit
MTPAIAVRGVTKTYDNRSFALNGADLDVPRGEVMLLKGPSGSGKTTLLSIMGCILQPTAGEVWINGAEVAKLPESKLPDVRLHNIGFIFQGFNLFPALTAAENVALTLNLKGVRGGEAKKRPAPCSIRSASTRSTTSFRQTSAADRSNASLSPVLWRASRKSSSPMSRQQVWTRQVDAP